MPTNVESARLATKAPKAGDSNGGWRGGGEHSIVDPSRRHLPKIESNPIASSSGGDL